MLPVKKEKKSILKCRDCGHEKPMKKKGYTVEYRIKHSPREKIVVVEEDAQTQNELTEDEKRERRMSSPTRGIDSPAFKEFMRSRGM